MAKKVIKLKQCFLCAHTEALIYVCRLHSVKQINQGKKKEILPHN